jgi:hypothetical protein
MNRIEAVHTLTMPLVAVFVVSANLCGYLIRRRSLNDHLAMFSLWNHRRICQWLL